MAIPRCEQWGALLHQPIAKQSSSPTSRITSIVSGTRRRSLLQLWPGMLSPEGGREMQAGRDPGMQAFRHTCRGRAGGFVHNSHTVQIVD